MPGAWRKRGRPRVDRPATDLGTPELQARREALARGGDPALAEHALGIMLARALISTEQYEAGCYYAALYARAVERPNLSVAALYRRLLGESGRGRDIEEADLEKTQMLYRKGKNSLIAAGRGIAAATENIAVFGRPSRFLFGPRNAASRRADAGELEAVREGLGLLVACYGRRGGRRASRTVHEAASHVATEST
jgi:hypothetical protein